MIDNTGIILDEATPLLARVQSAAMAKGLALVGARAVGQQVKDHLYRLDQARHLYGRHFYRQAADSVTARVVEQGGAVTITQLGFRQRLKGGRITAGQNGSGKQFLTIADEHSAEAQAHRATEFHDLHMTQRINPKTDRLQWCLVRNLSTPIAIRQRKQKDGTYRTRIVASATRGGEVMYWLAHSIVQKPDPTVLPADQAMSGTAIAAMSTEIIRPGRKSTGTPGGASS